MCGDDMKAVFVGEYSVKCSEKAPSKMKYMSFGDDMKIAIWLGSVINGNYYVAIIFSVAEVTKENEKDL
jgi:hypothetical protein